ASISTAPWATSIAATVLLPDPTPPVSPTRMVCGSATGELLAQRVQRLVRGERAAVLRRLRAVRRGLTGLDRSLGVGLLRFLELTAVRLEPLAGRRVATLPLLALAVVTGQPLLRLR